MDYILTAAQHATRVRLDVSGSDPVAVKLGDPGQSWVPGTYIEVLLMSGGIATFEPFDGSVTVNIWDPGNSPVVGSIVPGNFARVSLVAPGEWDVHTISGVSTMDSIRDTNINSANLLSSGDVLRWNASTEMWQNEALVIDGKPRPLETVAFTGNLSGFSALHHNTHFRSSAATDVTITVQLDSNWSGAEEWFDNYGSPTVPGPMPTGGSILVGKHGAGNVTFVAAPGVVINTPDTLVLNKLHGKVTLIKAGPNMWDLEGNLATA